MNSFRKGHLKHLDCPSNRQHLITPLGENEGAFLFIAYIEALALSEIIYRF